MPRPKNKADLLKQSSENFDKLIDFVDNLSEADLKKSFPSSYLNENVRDVIAHLHHWHLLLCEWYKVGMQGKKPDMPAPGYTWKTLPELNTTIKEKYKNTSYKEARKLLMESYDTVQSIIRNHTNEDLFTKKKYKWTGTTSLGAYMISATSSHYDWAIKLIKKCLK